MATQKNPKPIVTVDGAVSAQVYPAKFTPFDVLKYLDRKMLKSAEGTFEIGTIEGGGVTATLAVDVAGGKITGVRPVSSAQLAKAPKGGPTAAVQKKILLQALDKLHSLGPVPVYLPKPVAMIFEDPIEIDWGPITIILGGGLSNICLNIGGVNGQVCSFCIFGPSVCSTMGPPD